MTTGNARLRSAHRSRRSVIDKRTIDLGPVAIEYAVAAGPRILGYSRHDGPKLFADLPTATIQHPAMGEYRLLGGHRLWRAPEQPAVTYTPDHGFDMEVAALPDGLSITGPVEPDGLTKTIRIRQRGVYTIVDHQLDNRGSAPISCAPWAITQLEPGGRAILPQTREAADTDGVLPNRHLVAWPYTDLSCPEIEFLPDAVVIHGSHRPYPTKVGQPNQRGWVAYDKDGEVFVKWAAADNNESADYVDLGATVQCYRDERFVELETLGPLATLDPGEQIEHREIWLLAVAAPEAVDDLLAELPRYPEVEITESTDI